MLPASISLSFFSKRPCNVCRSFNRCGPYTTGLRRRSAGSDQLAPSCNTIDRRDRWWRHLWRHVEIDIIHWYWYTPGRRRHFAATTATVIARADGRIKWAAEKFPAVTLLFSRIINIKKSCSVRNCSDTVVV